MVSQESQALELGEYFRTLSQQVQLPARSWIAV